ncbi:hypothetical protein [Streptococcus equi]|uniref:hypothetical protein n=1 Tax=Streptococcus equi TaxID=1336 RepID=UPI0022ABC1C9|nr:hypothetical protein [Streptococcus equi]
MRVFKFAKSFEEIKLLPLIPIEELIFLSKLSSEEYLRRELALSNPASKVFKSSASAVFRTLSIRFSISFTFSKVITLKRLFLTDLSISNAIEFNSIARSELGLSTPSNSFAFTPPVVVIAPASIAVIAALRRVDLQLFMLFVSPFYFPLSQAKAPTP